MEYSKDKINELLVAVRANPYDKESFDTLYTQLKAPIYLVARRYLQKPKFNEYDCEDIVGNTFVKMLEKIDSLKTIKNGAAWVLKIAERLCKMLIRKRRKEVLTDKIETTDKKDFTEDTHNEIVLGEIMKDMSEQERAIIVLNDTVELTHQDIANILKVSKSTVDRRIREIRKNYQKYNE